MHNFIISFEILDCDHHVTVGCKKITGNMVLDVKVDFTRNARWVLDGNRTPDPEGSLYARVVSRDPITISLTYGAWNVLDVVATDISNAHFQDISSKKNFIICGTEFLLKTVVKKAITKREIYGGKFGGRDFINNLCECMRHPNFE